MESQFCLPECGRSECALGRFGQNLEPVEDRFIWIPRQLPPGQNADERGVHCRCRPIRAGSLRRTRCSERTRHGANMREPAASAKRTRLSPGTDRLPSMGQPIRTFAPLGANRLLVVLEDSQRTLQRRFFEHRLSICPLGKLCGGASVTGSAKRAVDAHVFWAHRLRSSLLPDGRRKICAIGKRR